MSKPYPPDTLFDLANHVECDAQFDAERVVAALRCMAMIEALRETEGNSVVIVCTNPDFNGQPNEAVTICASWTGWDEERFTGDTLHDALRAAYDAMKARA
jgi:hypothetical protein